jgi:hypothetical protein
MLTNRLRPSVVSQSIYSTNREIANVGFLSFLNRFLHVEIVGMTKSKMLINCQSLSQEMNNTKQTSVPQSTSIRHVVCRVRSFRLVSMNIEMVLAPPLPLVVPSLVVPLLVMECQLWKVFSLHCFRILFF